MDRDLEIQRLLKQLAETERQRDEAERQRDEAGRQRDEAGRQRDEAGRQRDVTEKERERVQQENDQLEQQNQLQQPTSFPRYLEYCHRFLYRSLTVRPDVSGTSVTKVDGKFYPFRLRRWEEFPHLQRREFDHLKGVLKDEPLFPSYIGVREMERRACETPVASEDDIKPFEHIAVEGPVADIIRAYCKKAASNAAVASLNVTSISFANHSLSINTSINNATRSDKKESTDKKPREPSPTKRVAIEPKEINPDRRCLRDDTAGKRTIAYIIEYKAMHKLQASQVRRGLSEHLFANVIRRRMSSKASNDSIQILEDRSDLTLAMVVTQAHDYKIKLGLPYSYINVGPGFLFLHVDAEDPATLYYHLALPDEDAEDENGELEESKTAVAQVASFTLLALRAHARPRSWTMKAQAALCQWPIPYPGYAEMESETTDEEELTRTLSRSSDLSFHGDDTSTSSRKIALRSGSTCKLMDVRGRKDDADDAEDGNGSSGQNPSSGPSNTEVQAKRKNLSSSSSGDSSFEQTSNVKERPRQYCTLGCLIGLKRGRELDDRCPNIASHRLTPESTTHPINTRRLAELLQEQLACCQDINCEPLEMKGMYGAVGTLFKLTLSQYGYTFVGKGTIRELIPDLTHEAKNYEQLEVLQGELVPVFLGCINLTTPYNLTAQDAVHFAGTTIVHMLLMSWTGETLKPEELHGLATEIATSLQKVRDEGVAHHDPRRSNLLWNKERHRVMVIDFDQAQIVPRPKSKQLERLAKRERGWSGCDVNAQRRKRMFLGTV